MKARIAEALGWSLADVLATHHHTLVEVVRVKAPELAYLMEIHRGEEKTFGGLTPTPPAPESRLTISGIGPLSIEGETP